MGIHFFDILGPSNTQNSLLLLTVFANISQLSVVEMSLIWKNQYQEECSSPFY